MEIRYKIVYDYIFSYCNDVNYHSSECVLATFRTILALSSIHYDHHLLPVDALKSSWELPSH